MRCSNVHATIAITNTSTNIGIHARANDDSAGVDNHNNRCDLIAKNIDIAITVNIDNTGRYSDDSQQHVDVDDRASNTT